ncbi:LOW QUALITY PROTEIN: uncharacterized protein LOC100367338 [Saccoglossus kowalevskii]
MDGFFSSLPMDLSDAAMVAARERLQDLVDFEEKSSGSGLNRQFVQRRITKRLKEVVGMDSLKKKVERLAIRTITNKVRSSVTKQVEEPLNLLFYGPPGSGKTMFARLLSGCLYDVGIIKENKMVEIQRDNVVASYVGESEKRIKQKIKSAAGGILFIDEAYSLYKGKSTNDFGIDIINTIMHYLNADAMENTPVFIMAGYQWEMERLLKANEGLLRRFRAPWIFPAYTAEELLNILLNKLTRQGFLFEGVEQDIFGLINCVPLNIRLKQNAGICGNIINYIKESIDERIVDLNDTLGLFTINQHDIRNAKHALSENLSLYSNNARRTVGTQANQDLSPLEGECCVWVEENLAA